MGFKEIGQSITSPTNNTQRRELRIENPPTYWLHVDADRDGVVDDDTTGLDAWTWGSAGKGAVILVNNNGRMLRSNPPTVEIEIDHEDDVVNGAPDIADLAPLDIRRTGAPPPADWKVTLSVSADDQQRIRVFDKRDASGAEIIGPNTSARYELPDLQAQTHELGIEALCYAGKDLRGNRFDGLVTLTLTIESGGQQLQQRIAKLRVAPWIMFHHFDVPEKIVVFQTRDNAGFVTELEAAAGAAGVPLEKLDGTAWRNDRWMQDILEFGYNQLPGQPPLRTVMETPRGRELENFPRTMISQTLGYLKPAPPQPRPSSLDAGGNLECTPPFTAPNGKRYPFGRMYLCSSRVLGDIQESVQTDYKHFLETQRMQPPLEINAGWLNVGHVDEIISFVRSPGSLGFKLLLASPRLGYELLRAAPANSLMLQGRNGLDGVSVESTVGDFLRDGIRWHGDQSSGRELDAYNTHCQHKVNEAEALFRRELGLTDQDIAYVPALYLPSRNARTADAITAGMVNMLVVGDHCIAPKPFGPVVNGSDVFEEHYRNTLSTCGLSVNFVDNWYTYHLLNGEVHCGTNTLRQPDASVKWWEFEP